MNFLDFGGYWDPSLAFVMGCGILVSGPCFLLTGHGKVSCPLNEKNKSFENPPKKGNYVPLLIGASLFGLGWGLVGLCPGPALVSIVPQLDSKSSSRQASHSFLQEAVTIRNTAHNPPCALGACNTCVPRRFLMEARCEPPQASKNKVCESVLIERAAFI